ncbi:MAG: hypothetical protein K2K56_13575 [Lachnospiraceae bacterium]|nr:hypothetical protein [Lachnospiraceae bacterium]
MKKKHNPVLLRFTLLFSLAWMLLPLKADAASITSLSPTRPGSAYRVSMDCDLDGDNSIEKLGVYYTQKDYYTDNIYLSVNGNNALVLDVSGKWCYAPKVNVVNSDNGNACIQIICHTDNDYTAFNQLFRYDSISNTFSLLLELHSGITKACQEVSKATSNGFIVKNRYQPCEIGWTSWNYTYVWTDGVPILQSTKNAVAGSIFKKNKFTTDKKITFYKTPGGKKKAFTIKRGKKVTLKYMSLTPKYMYAGFKYGKKIGWLRIDRDYGKVYKWDKKKNKSRGYFKNVAERLVG